MATNGNQHDEAWRVGGDVDDEDEGADDDVYQQAPLYGFVYDRHWVVVRADTGKFITQRQIPKLCLVSTQLPHDVLLGSDWSQQPPGVALTLSAPGMPELKVPLTDPAEDSAPGTFMTVTVWHWTGTAVDEGEAAAAWFSQYLETPCRLVRSIDGRAPNSVRPANDEFAPHHTVKFADQFPVLVAMEENLADLNARIASSGSKPQQALPMQRFRPNIVLAGAGSPWCDDGWKRIALGPPSPNASVGGSPPAVMLAYVKPCSRCKVTTVNQDTAEVGDEPLHTLGCFRAGADIKWAEGRKAWQHAVFFGWDAVVEQQGKVSVGDVVTVVEAVVA
eukprot:gene9816-9974_t